MEVSKLIEEAMREKLEREDPEYQSQPQPQPQPQSQSQLSKILKLIKENPDMIKKLKHELPPAVLRNIEKGAFESKEVKIDPTYEQKIKNIVETKKATKT